MTEDEAPRGATAPPALPRGLPLALQVAVPGPFREPLDYAPPAGAAPGASAEALRPGVRLRVPLGRRRVVGV
ncbi:MAG: hypothetical protein D6809_04260, partial [Gammaproteobacteria bacterium]